MVFLITVFYYPYPDYKFPREVFTDESLKEQKYGLPTWNFTKYRMALFREGQVAETIQQDWQNGLFCQFFSDRDEQKSDPC